MELNAYNNVQEKACGFFISLAKSRYLNFTKATMKNKIALLHLKTLIAFISTISNLLYRIILIAFILHG